MIRKHAIQESLNIILINLLDLVQQFLLIFFTNGSIVSESQLEWWIMIDQVHELHQLLVQCHLQLGVEVELCCSQTEVACNK